MLIKSIVKSLLVWRCFELDLKKLKKIMMPKEKKYRIKLTEEQIELLCSCHSYGIHNADQLKSLVENKIIMLNKN